MWRVLVVVLAGCGRIGFDPLAPDAAASAVPFDQPFGAPQPIAELASSQTRDDPSLTGDLLELYFSSDSSGQDVIYSTTRASVMDSWPTPVAIDVLNAGGGVNNPKVTVDGLMIYFASGRTPNAGAADLWKATRPDRASAWSAPVRVTELATADDDYECYELPDHLSIYYVRDPAGNPDLLWSTRAATTDTYGPGMKLASLDSPGYDGGPWVTPDGLGMLFHSMRGGGEVGIYRTVRASLADDFGIPVKLAELEGPNEETDPWLSPDGHTLYFSSDRDGHFALYTATR